MYLVIEHLNLKMKIYKIIYFIYPFYSRSYENKPRRRRKQRKKKDYEKDDFKDFKLCIAPSHTSIQIIISHHYSHLSLLIDTRSMYGAGHFFVGEFRLRCDESTI